MQYIILDLEWNNSFSKKNNGIFNEIIEIGAVKLNEKLEQTGTFSLLIKTQVSKKLKKTISRLTNISNEEMLTGVSFNRAYNTLKAWFEEDEDDSILITWGDSDVRVLLENIRYFKISETVDFLRYYLNLQQHVQSIFNLPGGSQPSLSTGAQLLGIDDGQFEHHRALGDSEITAECFKRVFNRNTIHAKAEPCSSEFFEKLDFKPYIKRSFKHPVVDKSLFKTPSCALCDAKCSIAKKWRCTARGFAADFICPNCKSTTVSVVQYKQFYDHIEIKKTSSCTPVKEEKKEQKNETEE